jgi:hypothetical protein
MLEKGSYPIDLVMVESFFIKNGIERSNTPCPLCKLLEVGFWIHIKCLIENIVKSRENVFQEKYLYYLESTIQVECTYDSLKRIRENIRILMSMGNIFTTRELDSLMELEIGGNLGKIATTYKCGANIGQLSFSFRRKSMKKGLCDNQFKHSIAEILESFIRFDISCPRFIENGTMNTRENVGTLIIRKNLKRSQELSHPLFKLCTIKTK